MSVEQNSYPYDGDTSAAEDNFSIGEYGREIGLKGFDFTGFNRYLSTGGATGAPLVELESIVPQPADTV